MLMSEALAQLLSAGNSPPLPSLIRNIMKTTAHVLLESAQFTLSGVSQLAFTLEINQGMRGSKVDVKISSTLDNFIN